MHFYELREGDDDVFSDILLVREEEVEPEEFFELVQGIRRRIIDTFQHDTLIEAIAEELERLHGFIAITDDRLDASVNVSREEDDNYLADLDEVPSEEVDYRSVLADFDPSGGRPN
jgi:hypothetical protein